LENPYVSVFTFFNIPKGTCIFIPATDVIWLRLEDQNGRLKGPDTPDAIRQRDAIFRFSLTDNFGPSLNFPNI
jgi:hypothetical protein